MEVLGKIAGKLSVKEFCKPAFSKIHDSQY